MLVLRFRYIRLELTANCHFASITKYIDAGYVDDGYVTSGYV